MISSEEDSISGTEEEDGSERVSGNPYPQQSRSNLNSLQSFKHLDIKKSKSQTSSKKRSSMEAENGEKDEDLFVNDADNSFSEDEDQDSVQNNKTIVETCSITDDDLAEINPVKA